MKTLTVYETSDGTRYDTKEDAKAHEILAERCRIAIAILGPPPDLKNGHYVQHDREACLQAKRNLLLIVREQFDVRKFPVLGHDDDAIHPLSTAGRIVLDGQGPLSDAWNRLTRINFYLGREYDQPYFAIHPDEALPQA